MISEQHVIFPHQLNKWTEMQYLEFLLLWKANFITSYKTKQEPACYPVRYFSTDILIIWKFISKLKMAHLKYDLSWLQW